MGMQYKELEGLCHEEIKPIAVCSLGDASCTEGEVAEAFQMAKKSGNGPKRSVLFLHVTGEEHGLLGAQEHARGGLDPLAACLQQLHRR